MTMMIFDGTTKRPMTDAEIAQYHAGDAEMDSEFESNVRNIRNKLLNDSDWTHMADCQLTDAEKTSWGVYRQALRDITAHEGFPNDIVWPSLPD